VRFFRSTRYKVHHVLDVAYNEDKCRIRKAPGAENMSTVRRSVQKLPKYSEGLNGKVTTNQVLAEDLG